MSLEDLLSVCSLLLLPAVGLWFLRVHLRETARGRPQSVRMQTEGLTLYSILKFFQVDSMGIFRMTSSARYFK